MARNFQPFDFLGLSTFPVFRVSRTFDGQKSKIFQKKTGVWNVRNFCETYQKFPENKVRNHYSKNQNLHHILIFRSFLKINFISHIQFWNSKNRSKNFGQNLTNLDQKTVKNGQHWQVFLDFYFRTWFGNSETVQVLVFETWNERDQKFRSFIFGFGGWFYQNSTRLWKS